MIYNSRLFYLILFQVVACLIWLSFSSNFLSVTGIESNDGPSYVNFDWSSLREILGAHRSFGYPLFLEIIYGLFGNYDYVPLVQVSAFFISILLLFKAFQSCLPQYSFSSFLFCSLIIWHYPVYPYFHQVLTETLGLAFLNLALAVSIWTYRHRSVALFFLLALTCIALFQIRTALVFACLLIPIWLMYLAWIDKVEKQVIYSLFIKAAMACVLPVIGYALLRLLIVGHFGLTSLNGILLSGHALTFIQPGDEEIFEGEVRELSDAIMERRAYIRAPCNTHFFSEKESLYEASFTHSNFCYGPFVMSNWLAAIEVLDGDTPFDDERKYEAWKHVTTLSNFYTRYSVDHDNLLMEFSRPIIREHFAEYLKWVAGSGLYSVKLVLKRYSIYFATLLVISILAGALISIYKQPQILAGTRFIAMIGFSFMLLSLVPVLFLNKVIDRFFDIHTIYMFTSFSLLIMSVTYKFMMQKISDEKIVKMRNVIDGRINLSNYIK